MNNSETIVNAQTATMHAAYHYLDNFVQANKKGDTLWSNLMRNAIDDAVRTGSALTPAQFKFQFNDSMWSINLHEVPGYFVARIVENHDVETYMLEWMKEEKREVHLVACGKYAMLVLFDNPLTSEDVFEYFTNLMTGVIPSRNKDLDTIEEHALVCLATAINEASPEQLKQIEDITHALDPSNPFITKNNDHFEAALAGVTIQALAMIIHDRGYKDMTGLRQVARAELSGEGMEYRITPLIVKDEKQFDIFATLNKIASPLGFEVQARKIDHTDYSLLTIASDVANLIAHTEPDDDAIINDFVNKIK